MTFSGTCSSIGITIGQVVNLETDLIESESPTIIVVKNLTPDMLAGFKQVIGIITENGGFTCHAAILARTMSVPAITGVRDATKNLHTGMMVRLISEKLAEQGFVEVIN